MKYIRCTEISDELKDATIVQLINLVIKMSKSRENAMQTLTGINGISCAILDKYYPGWEVYMPDEDEGGDE